MASGEIRKSPVSKRKQKPNRNIQSMLNKMVPWKKQGKEW